MLGTDQPVEIIEAGSAENTKPACTALVPLAEPVRWANRLPRRSLPDPTFVTQLIAASEHFPQARSLRRAEVSDALSAYAPPPRVQRSGLRTRQSI
jgi:hypothetical protein